MYYENVCHLKGFVLLFICSLYVKTTSTIFIQTSCPKVTRRSDQEKQNVVFIERYKKKLVPGECDPWPNMEKYWTCDQIYANYFQKITSVVLAVEWVKISAESYLLPAIPGL
jgi:hypothetical protein